MKKLFFCLSAIAMQLTVNAQYWTGTTVPTTTAGAVGIGTVTPAGYIPLSVLCDESVFGGSGIVTTFKKTAPSTASSGQFNLLVSDFDDGFGDILMDAQGNADIALRTQGGAGGVLVLKKGGNVGIGTSSPQQNLHVYSGNSDAQIVTESPNNTSIRFTKSGTGSWMAGMQYHDWVPKFCINNSSTFDENPEFTILPSGNVGVSTIYPSAKFHVNGSLRFQGIGETAGYVLTTDASGNATWQATTPSVWNKTGNDINYTAGRVGIGGVINPDEPYAAALKIVQPAGVTRNYKVLDMMEGNRRMFFVSNTDVGGYNDQTGSGDFGLFWNDGVNGLGGKNTNAGLIIAPHITTKGGIRIDATGKVGIGTNTPTANLHVAGSVKLEGISAAAGYVLTSDATGNATWQALPATTSVWSNNSSGISYSSGNVGIGTDASSIYSLHIKQTSPFLRLESTGYHGLNSATLAFGAGTNGGSEFLLQKFSGNGADGFRIINISNSNAAGVLLSNGNVQIGGATFDNSGNLSLSTGGLTVNQSSNTNYAAVFSNGGGQGSGVQIKAGFLGGNYKMFDVSDYAGNSYFRVSGIDGVTYAQVIKVKTDGFPDYVFEKEYKLMPLNELDKFITENNHLPNINTAADVKENGLTLGEMQVKQMEKIEELTLYIIQLKKEVDALKAAHENK